MESLAARLKSFAKSSRSKSSTNPLGLIWPHPASFVATPDRLAEAGFYFKPGKNDVDNVACFLCGKELCGWDEEDNPMEIHMQKSPKCPWALARCSLDFDYDSDGNFNATDPTRLPTSKALEKARLDTFGGKGKWWPHDATKNHGASSKKMAKAGFAYAPQALGDDTATCFYCDISLSGWDTDDDPLTEHRKRESRSGRQCPFFHNGRTGRKGKAPMNTPLEDHNHDEEDELAMSKSESKTTESNSVEPKQTTRRNTRSKSAAKQKAKPSTAKNVIIDDLDSADPVTEDRPERAPRVAPQRKAKKDVSLKLTTPLISKVSMDAKEPTSIPDSAEGPSKMPTTASTPVTARSEEMEEVSVPLCEGNMEGSLAREGVVDHDLREPVVLSETFKTPQRIGTTPSKNIDETAYLLNDVRPESFAPFFAPLSDVPVKQLSGLTDEERAMTVEQWIRHEMNTQYEQLKRDGERRIEAFMEKAREVRAIIEAL